jgi:hypothetical protein
MSELDNPNPGNGPMTIDELTNAIRVVQKNCDPRLQLLFNKVIKYITGENK